MKLKVCGMADAENIAAVLSCKPDYLGFVLYSESPRYVDVETCAGLLSQISDGVKSVAVVVNMSEEAIARQIVPAGFTAVQLHGEETVDYCGKLRSTCSSLQIIKAFAIGEEFSFDDVAPYQQVTDYFLFDTKSSARGGSGMSFDWGLLENYPFTKPFFLSGGIGPENAAMASRLTKRGLPLHAIDVNSRVEVKPGLKDVTLVKKVVEEIRDELSR